jgi:hypothetical protein
MKYSEYRVEIRNCKYSTFFTEIYRTHPTKKNGNSNCGSMIIYNFVKHGNLFISVKISADRDRDRQQEDRGQREYIEYRFD